MSEPSRPQVLPIMESSISTNEKVRMLNKDRILRQTVDNNYADLICIILCFVTGLCDSSAFNAWSCFLAMQTGNTVVLGLGAANLPADDKYSWLKALVSVSSFVVGSFVFSFAGRILGPTRRGTLFASFMVQVILIVIAVSLIQTGIVARGDVSSHNHPLLDLIPIGLLAFQSSGSINSTRSLGFNEIPSVVITSVYFDIASDKNILAVQNVKRNRRVAGVVMLLIGAIVGGWLNRSEGGMASTFWLAAGIKFVIGFGWLFWLPKRVEG
ncbi:hypothetical protein BO70DRAFT_283548 [Aspergillus heteromorphus CBS 117.55]|uniref:DUF1275 domain protein n=1 Tax=Aspergillus heteromorphus CBS 117.55 TaxID=1448321 RepID=A0A317X211_9EURO|nr:uncharacterized protein BO70DRAFT_283548 [Aspergillus heteromorphus CBS 117.55]PWY91028.1 hypothetical protein BO70DRAFT_283548 [Aspergillus heteromorphus CBS 117.55]